MTFDGASCSDARAQDVFLVKVSTCDDIESKYIFAINGKQIVSKTEYFCARFQLGI